MDLMSHFGILLLTQVSRKTCSSCFAAISQKKKVAAKKVVLKGPKNRNAGRVVDSAHIAVSRNAHISLSNMIYFTFINIL